jgi:hypothetical protein
MKKSRVKKRPEDVGELLPEYRFNYRRGKANRFAAKYQTGSRVVVLDADVAQVFTTPEAVNSVLRALLTTMPK